MLGGVSHPQLWKGEASMQRDDVLVGIVEKFAHSGWDLIAGPAQDWLDGLGAGDEISSLTETLIAAVEQADVECGSCGCEFDPLYKEFLAQMRGA
jgi:hypothetical protein